MNNKERLMHRDAKGKGKALNNIKVFIIKDL